MSAILEGLTVEAAEAELYSRRLYRYVKAAWSQVLPATPYVDGWHIGAMAEHLQAVSEGQIQNLWISVAPRHTKSLTVSVMWPTWDWTRNPARQFLFGSYGLHLATRDAVRSRRLMESPWYQARWGCQCRATPHASWCTGWRFTSDQNVKTLYENDRTGRRLTASVEAGTTGEGGDVLVLDDPIDIVKALSETSRRAARTYVEQVWIGRRNDPKTSRMVGIAQRTHEEDVTAFMLNDSGLDFVHLCLPTEYRIPPLVEVTKLGFRDPRTRAGELLWEARFGHKENEQAKRNTFVYACTPAETPILMADWTIKPISLVVPGDRVLGWERGTPGARARLIESVVRRTFQREAEVVAVRTESGRSARCTADHKWYTGRCGIEWSRHGRTNQRQMYMPAAVRRRLLWVDADIDYVPTERERQLWHWLAGMFDGEGTAKSSALSFCQSPTANPEVWARLQAVLRELGVSFKAYRFPAKRSRWGDKGQINVRNSRQLAMRLLRFGSPAKRVQLEQYLRDRSGTFVRAKDKVVAIKPGPTETVYALETTTGNYVAWSFASSNSQHDQNPTPAGGGIIKRHWFRFWQPAGIDLGPVVDPKDGQQRVCQPLPPESEFTDSLQSWDLNKQREVVAIRKGQDPDPVAGGVFSRRGGEIYLRERVNRLLGIVETIEAIAAVSQRWPQAGKKLIEYAANGPAVIALMRRKLGGFLPVTPVGSKTARLVTTAGATEEAKGGRAMSASEFIASGGYFLPHPLLDWCEACGALSLDCGYCGPVQTPWVWSYVDTFAAFPNVAHDDDVDVFSQACMRLEPWIWREADQDQRSAVDHGKPPETVQEVFRQRLAKAMQPKKAQRPVNPWNRR